jgi:hypothetical protein
MLCLACDGYHPAHTSTFIATPVGSQSTTPQPVCCTQSENTPLTDSCAITPWLDGCFLQVGSQHRDKAEPAGAVQFGKWVPKSGTQTLTGPPRKPYCRDLSDPPPPPPPAQ